MEEIPKEIFISFSLASFFALAMFTFGLSSIVNLQISPVSVAMLIVALFQIYLLRNIYFSLKEKNYNKAISELNNLGIINLILSVIFIFLISASIWLELQSSPELGLDLAILYEIYYVAFFIGLGFSSGLYSWIAASKLKG
ncbi:MAG: hypothetical protein RQ952_02440 [Thermoproteota archaeon]|jgi:hypothetical protein|nr:hypothetical protein [Thermoproteota archaeon]